MTAIDGLSARAAYDRPHRMSNGFPARAILASGVIAFAAALAIGAVSMREPIAGVMTSNFPPRISEN